MNWNCYARNYYLGEVTARNHILAMEIACELWKKFNIIMPEVSVIPVHKDPCRQRFKLENSKDYRVKYP